MRAPAKNRLGKILGPPEPFLSTLAYSEPGRRIKLRLQQNRKFGKMLGKLGTLRKNAMLMRSWGVLRSGENEVGVGRQDYIVRLICLPHEGVAEVSKDKAPIGRRREIQFVRKSIESRFNCFEGQLICDSIALRFQVLLV